MGFPKLHFDPREERAEATACSIPLTHGYAALLDPEDYQRFFRFKWTAQIGRRGQVYAYRNQRQADGRYKNIFLHRLIAGAKPGQLVDHANRNTLDCRRANLRIATSADNCRNRTARANKRGYIGVCADGGDGSKVRGCVSVGRRKFYTPYTSSIEQAARDRDALALRLHGEFAVLNFNPGRKAA